MISLNRIGLVNWHNFVNETLTLADITFMIGMSGVGKTTVLDGLRYCLTADKKFNVLGNNNGGRSLQGFVHAQQRDSNHLYSRPGHTVSFVGVEFLDQTQNKTFVITVRVESESPEQELRHVRQTWYISPLGIRLEDLPFIDPMTNAPSSRDKFCIPSGKMPPIDRQGEAVNMICQRIGIGKADSPLGKKFLSVFPMGTSLKNISDIRDFIYNYILPEPTMDLEALQKDERELESLQETLMQAQRRAQQLREIVTLGEQALERERNVRINSGFVLFAQYQLDADRQERLFAERDRYSDILQRLENQYEEARQQADAAHDAYQLAWKAVQDSDEGKALEALRQKEKDAARELMDAKRKVDQYKNAYTEVNCLLQKAGAFYPVEARLYPDAIRNHSQRSYAQMLETLGDEILKMREHIKNSQLNLQMQLANVRNEIATLVEKIRSLEKGQFLYPDKDAANVVKDAINKALAQQGLEQDAKVLCELLYMNDESWQDCVESCLGYRRFDILVSPEHYSAAKVAFERLGASVGRVGLLDSRALYRIRDKSAAGEDTLASKVSSENMLAHAYVNDLLGEIVCCDDSSELENHPHSATRELLRHYPYRLARLKKQERYIGLEARKAQLEEAKRQHEQLVKQRKEFENQGKTVTDILEAAERVVHQKCVGIVSELWDSNQVYDDCVARNSQIKNEIVEWENNPLLRGKQAQERQAKMEWEAKKKLCEDIAGDKKSRENDLSKCEQEINRTQYSTARSLAAWEEFGDEHPTLLAEVEAKYADAAKSRTSEEVVRNQTTYQRILESSRDNFINNQLIPAQRQFNQEYSCDMTVGLDGISLFVAQYDQLVNIDLEHYTASLQRAKERCRERFRKDILYRMKDDIRNALRQFRDLNKVMSGLRYSVEKYHFHVQESQDPENSRIYKMIMAEQNEEMTQEDSLFNMAAQADRAYEAQIDEFVERILSAAREAADARQRGKSVDKQIVNLVDYRKYLDYDIIITNTQTNAVIPLSAVIGVNSGGEGQGPFYTAICASLLQIYQKCDNSIRFIMLDEAFSAMSGDRIQPAMDLFQQMGLQALLVATIDKGSEIQPMCGLTYSIAKVGNRNSIAPFYKEDPDDDV